MSWAIALWVGYGIFTVAVFGLALYGLNYAQKVLLNSDTDEEE